MSRKQTLSILCVFACLAITVPGRGQGISATPPATSNTIVPALSKYSGTLKDLNGKPITYHTEVTFSIFSAQEGGDPLWTETQNVEPDQSGHYTVTLGSTTSKGLPADVFKSGEARWLGVRIAGQMEDPRAVLMSEPYALKAQDAATIGGLPPSAFLLANGSQGSTSTTDSQQTSPKLAAATTNPDVTGKGMAGFIPLWDSASDITDSTLFQNSYGIGIKTTSPGSTLDVNGPTIIRHTLTLEPTTAKLQVYLQILGTNFQINGPGKMNFIAGQTYPGAPTLTGAKAGSGLSGGGSTGNVNLALTNACSAGQTLKWNGSAWVCASTPMNITAGTDLMGGGSSGKVTLNLNTNAIPQLGSSNTFHGTQSIAGNLSLNNTTGLLAGVLQIGPTSFLHNYGVNGSYNTFVGGAGNFASTGINLTGVGYGALAAESSGSGNTAFGLGALPILTSGSYNSALGFVAGYALDKSSITGNNNTLLGAGAGVSTGAFTNATALGSNAVVAQSNALVLGCVSGQNNCTGNVNVGIDTTTPAYRIDVSNGDAIVRGANNFVTYPPNVFVGDGSHRIRLLYGGFTRTAALTRMTISPYPFSGTDAVTIEDGTGNLSIGTTSLSNILTLGQNVGHAIADHWDTYSSRRWKTNIQTLQGSLAKVEQLRGVSYDLKSGGKHEIGLIAEEVGAVVPEVVAWEENGKDAKGVDYSRLTALLIEATKEKQALIDKQKAQIRAEKAQLEALQAQIEAQQVAAIVEQGQIATLKSQLRTLQAAPQSTISNRVAPR